MGPTSPSDIFLPSDAQILLHYWATMLDEAAAKAAKRVLLVRGNEARTLDRLFSGAFIEWGGGGGAAVAPTPSSSSLSSSSTPVRLGGGLLRGWGHSLLGGGAGVGGGGGGVGGLGSSSSASSGGGAGQHLHHHHYHHPTQRMKLVVRSEAPRCVVHMRVDGALFHSRETGGVDGGDLPRTLALFGNLLLHEIPGAHPDHGSGEVGIHATTLDLKRGLEGTLFPYVARAAGVVG